MCLWRLVTVYINQEDVLPLVPTAHDMIDRAWVLDSELAPHAEMISRLISVVKPPMGIFLRSDPIDRVVNRK
jgi:hypothetical protein